MSKRWMIPMIDFVFLSVGGLLAMLTQMEVVSAVPLDLAAGEAEASMEVDEASRDVVAITDGALTLNDAPITIEELRGAITRRVVLVRADREARVDRLTAVLTAVHGSGDRDVRLQFRGAASPVGGGQ